MDRDHPPEQPRLRLAAVLAAGVLTLAGCTVSLATPAGVQASTATPAAADAAEDQGEAVPPRFGDDGRTRDGAPDRVGIGPLPLLTFRF